MDKSKFKNGSVHFRHSGMKGLRKEVLEVHCQKQMIHPALRVTTELITGFKFNFFDSLLKLASGIIFYLLNHSANLLFHTNKQLNVV